VGARSIGANLGVLASERQVLPSPAGALCPFRARARYRCRYRLYSTHPEKETVMFFDFEKLDVYRIALDFIVGKVGF
jgi:hypothetical protein